MIESVKIENFRCFSELEVHGLKPINIIVGENASGKSAFLEAIYISSSAVPHAVFQIRAARLGSPLELRSDFSSYGGARSDSSFYWGLWEDLFNGYDVEKSIRIEVTGAESSRTQVISRDLHSRQIIPLGINQSATSPFPLISFRWNMEGYEPTTVIPMIRDNALIFEGGSNFWFPSILFGPNISESPRENATRFSTLSKDGKHQSVIEALREEFPFVRNLSLEINAGVATVFAETEGQSRRLPIGLISDGVNKLLSILLGIATSPNGTILIDQIEDGFYFKKLASTWKVIHKFAKANGTQIFATTHSQECLSALLPVLEAHQDDFALLRASRSGGVSKLTVIDGKGFSSMLSQEFEVR